MPLKALLFDVDGTLADTEPQGHLPAYNEAFAEMGLDWRWSAEFYRDELLLLPGGRERLLHFIVEHQPSLGRYEKDRHEDLVHWVNDIHAVKSRWFRRRLEEGKVALRPGISRLITEAYDQGVQLAVVTNASERSLKPFLNYTLGVDLLKKFRYIVSGEQVANKKPAPDLYLRAIEKLGVSPEECLVIEDSAMGLGAAVAAGLPVIVTTNEDTENQNFTGARAIVNHLGDPGHPWQVSLGQDRLPANSYATTENLQALLKSA